MYMSMLNRSSICYRINLNQYIGLVVEIRTTYGEMVTGEIFCYDEGTKTIVLKLPVSDTRSSSVFLLKTDYIKSLSVVGSNGISEFILPHITSQSTNKLASNNENKMASMYDDIRDPYGSYVFDKLSKFVSCQWKDDVIVADDVTIYPPYCYEDVKGPEDNVNRICQWVKLVKRSDLEH